VSSVADNDVDRLRSVVDNNLPSPPDIVRLCTVRGGRGRDDVIADLPACPLLAAVDLPDTAILTYLLDTCCIDPDHSHSVVTIDRKSPATGSRPTITTTRALHAAVRCGSIDAVEVLLDAGADPNAEDGNGQTPLQIAVARTDCDLVRLLMSRGADRTTTDPVTGDTPLHVAAALGHSQLVQYSYPRQTTR
jgi:ankyrin repeat protein